MLENGDALVEFVGAALDGLCLIVVSSVICFAAGLGALEMFAKWKGARS